MSKINDAYNRLAEEVQNEIDRLEATGDETDASLAEFLTGKFDEFASGFADYADLTTRGLDSEAIMDKLEGWGFI